MSKIENNRIYYDPYNEIRCDRFALEKLVKESEEKDKTIADLEAKLAEKEKENELMAKTLRMTKCIEKEINQDKISFAVEQLEKVKELLLSKAIQITGTSVDTVRLYSINEIFNNQIKQLKEMK